MTQSVNHRPTVSAARIYSDLHALGVVPGMLLIVHSSLSAIGWVEGGAPTVVRTLVELLGEEGTLVMPAATPECGETVPSAEASGTDLTPFDRERTPTSMGAIAETFRTWPGTRRSDHPMESVCARGPLAAEITAAHPYAFSEGPGTPFGKLHARGGQVMLLGVGFNRCTALHLAETLAERRRTMTVCFPVVENGRSRWIEVTNVADDNDAHFPLIGEAYLAAGKVRRGQVGAAATALFPMRELVAFATRYFNDNL